MNRSNNQLVFGFNLHYSNISTIVEVLDDAVDRLFQDVAELTVELVLAAYTKAVDVQHE